MKKLLFIASFVLLVGTLLSTSSNHDVQENILNELKEQNRINRLMLINATRPQRIMNTVFGGAASLGSGLGAFCTFVYGMICVPHVYGLLCEGLEPIAGNLFLDPKCLTKTDKVIARAVASLKVSPLFIASAGLAYGSYKCGQYAYNSFNPEMIHGYYRESQESK